MSSHRKRPRDPSQLAKLVVDIATGGVTDKLWEIGDVVAMLEKWEAAK
jgi:hypothetical protein